MFTMMHNLLYGNFRTRTFSDIWESAEDFLEDYKENPELAILDDNDINLLFYLLYARYGNSHIASSDENQFKYKVFTTIFMYGPTWKKRLELQKDIRDLSIQQIMDGALVIFNHSYNPSTEPNTNTDEPLPTINEQHTNRYKKSVSDSYMLLNDLLETDVTAYFLDRFKNLFLKIVEPELPLWYVTDLEIEGDE